MQADAFRRASAGASLHKLQRLLGHCFPGLEQVRRHERALEQVGAGVVAEVSRRQSLTGNKGLRGANGMDAAEEAADPLQDLRISQLGRPAAAARVDRDAKSAERRRALRSDDRDLAFGELVRESVLLVDLRLAPA